LGTIDKYIYEDVKNILYTNSTVTRDTAGISMGNSATLSTCLGQAIQGVM